MPPRTLGPARQRLARRLTVLAEDADVGPSELGERIGRDRSAVYRIQTGQTLPGRPVIRAYLAAINATDDVVREVLDELVEDAQTETRSWRTQARGGSVQHLVSERLAGARLVCAWSPVRIPGLLQTAAYARRLLAVVADDAIDPETTIAARMVNQHVLDSAAHRLRFVVSEQVIAQDLGDPAIHDEQVTQVARLASRDNVEVLVVPDHVVVPTGVPFTIYDEPVTGAEPVVSIELPHGSTTATGDAVAVYRALFDRIAALAAPLS